MVIVPLAGGLFGCAPELEMVRPDVWIAPARLATMPALVRVFEVDAEGKATVQLEAGDAASQNLDQAIDAAAEASGARPFDGEDIGRIQPGYENFREWSREAMDEIWDEMTGRSHRGSRSVSDWRYPGSLSSWRGALRADFVLAVLIQSASITAGGLLGGYLPLQRTMACVIDLRSGRVVWCHRIDPLGDIGTRIGAARNVRELLSGLMPPRRAGASH